MSMDGKGYLTEERRMIRDAAREFTIKEVLPVANKLDGPEGEIPMELRSAGMNRSRAPPSGARIAP